MFGKRGNEGFGKSGASAAPPPVAAPQQAAAVMEKPTAAPVLAEGSGSARPQPVPMTDPIDDVTKG